MEPLWMLLALLGFAEIAAFAWICRFVKRQLEGVKHQVRRVTAILDVLEEQAAMYERATEGGRNYDAEPDAGLAEPDTP